MSTVVSAGILLKSKDLYLIGGAARDINAPHGWGIPKGKVEKNESLRDAALREFYEETSLDLTKHAVKIATTPKTILRYKIKKGKKELYVYEAEDLTDGGLIEYPFHSLSYTEKGNPELFHFLWLPKEQALEKITKSQKPLFE